MLREPKQKNECRHNHYAAANANHTAEHSGSKTNEREQ
jgi:hypothetical protein